jgi:hypothetical protein
VVESLRPRGTDVHGRAAADRFKPLQDLNF